jgi:DNA-binding response OmpR family regulator
MTSRATPTGSAIDGRGLLALVVDDEAQIRATTAGFLRLSGFEVIEAPDGEAGLDVVRASDQDVSLVVLDGQMPGLSGEQTLGAIHALQPNLPVLFCSGFDVEAIRGRLSDCLHVRFLDKPFTMDEFYEQLETLEAHLQPTSGRESVYS